MNDVCKFKPVDREAYSPSAEIVAPNLLGHWLIRNTPSGLCGGPIVETEAYLAGDPACHAFVGLTSRNRVMWGRPGFAYVYLIYGFHFCVNAVCRPQGVAEAVLIRAIDAALGTHLMMANRPTKSAHELTSGPGKLCAAMAITRELDGADLSDERSPLFIAENPDRAQYLKLHGPVRITERIGITKAADLPLRFFLRNSPFVSRRMRERIQRPVVP